MAEAVAMADMLSGMDDEFVSVTWHNTCPQCGAESNTTQQLNAWVARLLTSETNTKHMCEACAEKKRLEEETERRNKRSAELIAHASIPKNFCEWDVKLGNAKLARSVRDNRAKSLFIAGPNNCCKTRAAAYNLYLEVKSGRWCKFMRFSELAAEYARICKIACEDAQGYISRLLNDNAILMVDDIGKRRITENAGELLYELFDRLYAGDTDVVIWCTCNTKLSELADRFENPDIGDAVASRIDRMIEAGNMAMIEV